MTFYDDLYAITGIHTHELETKLREVVDRWRKRRPVIEEVLNGRGGTFELRVFQIRMGNLLLERFRKGIGAGFVNGSPSFYSLSRQAEEDLHEVLPTMTYKVVDGRKVWPSEITKPANVFWPTAWRDLPLFFFGSWIVACLFKGIFYGEWSLESVVNSAVVQLCIAATVLVLIVLSYPARVMERKRYAEQLMREAKFVDAAIRLLVASEKAT